MLKALAGSILLFLLASFPAVAEPSKVTAFPQALDPECRDGRAKLYDQCGDQLALYEAAFAQAQAEEKVLLVSLGAEWCVWCHVFSLTVATPNAPLEMFTAERFVIVHVDAQYGANHKAVLRTTSADTVYTGGLPLLFAVAADGTFAGAVEHRRVANGSRYDLPALEKELGRLYTRALIPDDPFRKLLRQLPPIGGFPADQAPSP